MRSNSSELHTRTSTRRSTVLILLPLQLDFPVYNRHLESIRTLEAERRSNGQGHVGVRVGGVP